MALQRQYSNKSDNSDNFIFTKRNTYCMHACMHVEAETLNMHVSMFIPACNFLYPMAEMFSICLHQDILNHCFDDVERFMAQLQQTAEAQRNLNERSKKRSKKGKKKEMCECSWELKFSCKNSEAKLLSWTGVCSMSLKTMNRWKYILSVCTVTATWPDVSQAFWPVCTGIGVILCMWKAN